MTLTLEKCEHCGSTIKNLGLLDSICPECQEVEEETEIVIIGPGGDNYGEGIFGKIIRPLDIPDSQESKKLLTVEDALEGG